MNIDELIINVKKKIKKNINIKNILIEDKTFLHKNHHTRRKFLAVRFLITTLSILVTFEKLYFVKLLPIFDNSKFLLIKSYQNFPV